jgi:hypothetical protein
MKFGKLLFAGKSVVNGSGTVSYRQDKRVALPKFVSPKNPFAPAKKPADGAAAPAKTETAPVPALVQKTAPAGGAPKSLTAWTTRLNPASLWGGAAPAPQKTLPAVQAELSLDAVKVVHNDLSDADVEVVPIKSRPAAAAAAATASAKNSWEILGERLLRATAL